MPYPLLVLGLVPLVWLSVIVNTRRLDQDGARQIRPRFFWSRVPAGYAGVVRRGRSVLVRSSGARVGRPFASLTLVSTSTMRRELGPIWIAMPDGGGLSATGTVGYHVSNPSEFSATKWGMLPRVLIRLIGAGIAEAAQKARVDPLTHPEVIDQEARRLLAAHLEPVGIAIDSLHVAFLTGTPTHLADAERAVIRGQRRYRWNGWYANGIMLALVLFFLGMGVWSIADSLWIRPAEYAHLERVGVSGVATVTDCTRSACHGDYSFGGRTYHETIPDRGDNPPGTTMAILIDPANPETFFPEQYVRSGRNAGLSPVLAFGLFCLGVAGFFGLSTVRLERKFRRLARG